jgi:WD40 repeat protein
MDAGRDVLRVRGSLAASWSPDGRRLATVADTSSGALDVGDAENGFKALSLKGPSTGGLLAGVLWSPDGRRLASFGNAVKVWLAAPWDADPGEAVPETRP